MPITPDLSLEDPWSVLGLSAAGVALLALLALVIPRRRREPPSILDRFLAAPVRCRAGHDEEELEWLPLDAPEGNRRQGLRRGGTVTPVEVADAPDGPAVEGLVIDRSAGGLRFAADAGIPVGARVFVRAAEGPWVAAEVRHCRTHADYFLVGCRFLESPPWAVRLLFG